MWGYLRMVVAAAGWGWLARHSTTKEMGTRRTRTPTPTPTARACGAHDVQQAIEHDGMSKHMSRDEHTSKQVSVPMPTNTYAAHDIEQAIEHDGSGADSLAAHRRYWMPLIIVWIRIKYLRTHARARACAWMRVRACARIGAIGCHSTEHLPRARGCV